MSDAPAKDAASILDLEPRLADAVSEWLGKLRRSLAGRAAPGRIEHVGRIAHVADGVATVTGLPGARFNELLRFPGDVFGLAFNLDPEAVGVVLLGDDTELSAGDRVHLTGEVVRAPAGEALLGRVVDPLGRPLDGAGAIACREFVPIEREAPPILARRPVEQQLITGVKAVDSMIPIGRGQRELIVGDRATGKTALAVDAIISQRDSDVICIYVAIGQRVASVKRVAKALADHDAMRRTIIVSSDADDAPGLQFIAPYAACAMGEYFMERGGDVLIIYDDLTRHARTYREISLLLRRPPGREAYPGDIFFIHSRLLERATRLTEEAGGGSLTAIPIVETQAKNISAYIPTNLISITDGQIFLDPDLFYKGVKPAIHVGKSVSRVGGKTQFPAIRSAAKLLRLEYAQFAELELFTRFGATVEEETRKKIERGRRIREILKQPRLNPLTAAEQVLILLAMNRGAADKIPLERMADYEKALRVNVASRNEKLVAKINAGEDLEEAEWDALAKAVEAAAADFVPAETDEEAEKEPEARKSKEPVEKPGEETKQQGPPEEQPVKEAKSDGRPAGT